MPTNLAIDDRLIEEARELGSHKTKKAAVTAAIEEYIRHRKQLGVVKSFGQIAYDPSYDYKAGRGKR